MRRAPTSTADRAFALLATIPGSRPAPVAGRGARPAFARWAATAALAATLASPGPAWAQPLPEAAPADAPERGWGIEPFVEARQSLALQTLGDDVRTYTNLVGGVNAFITRERVQGTLSAAGTYRLPLGAGRERFSTSLLGRGSAELVRDSVFVEASAYAALQNRDFAQGFILDPEDTDDANLAQTYGASISPRLRRELGDVAIVTARYQLAYTDVDETFGGSAVGLGGGAAGSGAGRQLAGFSDSLSHTIDASIANIPRGRLQVTLAGRMTFEDQTRLEQKYRNESLSADFVYAVGRQLSLLGNAGYEKYDSSQQAVRLGLAYLAAPFGLTLDGRDPSLLFNLQPPAVPPGSPQTPLILRNFYAIQGPPGGLFPLPPGNNFVLAGSSTTTNLSDPNLVLTPGGFSFFDPVVVGIGPLIGADGDFIADPTQPRRTLYAQDGLSWNVGARYTPSRRTLIELRVGQRFDDLVITGSIRHQTRRGITISGQLSDGIETFGQVLTETINGVPVSFAVGRSRGRNSGGSGFVDGRLQSITSAVFRSRIGNIGVSGGSERTRWNVGLTYNRRDYLDSNVAAGPDAPLIDPTLVDRNDTTITLDTRLSRTLRPGEEITGGLFFSDNDLGLTRPRDDQYVGGSIRYDRRLSDRLRGFANLVVLERFSNAQRLGGILQDDRGDRTTGNLSVGVRYEF